MMLTNQFPPPTELTADEGPFSPNVNILKSPFEMTTNTSIQFRFFAFRFDVSQYCFLQSIPSFAQGAPSRASSSSVMLTEDDAVSALWTLRASSSVVSLMIE